MKKQWRVVWQYIKARVQESSTWRGLALLGAVAGAKLDPQQTEAFVLLGLALSAVIALMFPDRKKPAARLLADDDELPERHIRD